MTILVVMHAFIVTKEMFDYMKSIQFELALDGLEGVPAFVGAQAAPKQNNLPGQSDTSSVSALFPARII